MKKFLIIVEGDADKKFIKDYYHHLFQTPAPKNSIIHTGGYKNLADEVILRQMQMNTDQVERNGDSFGFRIYKFLELIIKWMAT